MLKRQLPLGRRLLRRTPSGKSAPGTAAHPLEGRFVVDQRMDGLALDEYLALASLRPGTVDVVALTTEEAGPYVWALRIWELRPGPLGAGGLVVVSSVYDGRVPVGGAPAQPEVVEAPGSEDTIALCSLCHGEIPTDEVFWCLNRGCEYACYGVCFECLTGHVCRFAPVDLQERPRPPGESLHSAPRQRGNHPASRS